MCLAGRTPPDVLTNLTYSWIISWSQQNVQAGSDSTAITLTAVFYYLLKNPESMQRLLELDEANLPSPVPWDLVHKLPFLDACVKEALRMTPALGIPLERVVPPQGAEVCGKYFKGGTILGVNAWVVRRNQNVYGDDAGIWRPARWVETSVEKRKEMERTLLTVSRTLFRTSFPTAASHMTPEALLTLSLFQFGGGSRICLGKNISFLEMYKVIPELLTRFKVCQIQCWHTVSIANTKPPTTQFKLVDPEKTWNVKNRFFTYIKGVTVEIERR